MEVLVGGRRSGKTDKILQWMLDEPEGEHRVIVSFSAERAHRLYREAIARGHNVNEWQFVGLEEVKSRTFSGVLAERGGHVVLGLDDTDIILRSLLAWPVEFITATGETI